MYAQSASYLLMCPFPLSVSEIQCCHETAECALYASAYSLGVFPFIFNRKYSFQSTAPLLGSAVRFAIVIAVCYLVSFGISDLLVPWAVGAFAWPIPDEWVTRIAMLVAQVIFTGMNYIGQRLWAFKN